MPFAAAVSDKSSLNAAIDEAVHVVAGELGRTPDLTFLFVTHYHYAASFSTIARFDPQTGSGGGLVLGCTGETVICGSREREGGPALCVWSGVLPGANLLPFQLEFIETPDGVMCDGLPDDLGTLPRHEP